MRAKCMFTGACLAILAASAARAQNAFDAASIRPSDSAAAGMQIGATPGGVFTAKNATLKALIQQAYGLRDFQIYGGPAWIDAQRYDITAKGNSAGVSEDELRQMSNEQRSAFQLGFKSQLTLKLRVLLADRFHLKTHRDTRELPVYALGIAKSGVKLRPSADLDITHSSLSVRRGDSGRTEVTGAGQPLASLVKALSDQVGRTVLDETGLQGIYDFKLTFAPDMASDTDAASIFTALQEQLGLRLDSRKAPVEVLVIESAQKASEN